MQRHHGLFDAGALMNLLHGNALKAGHISNNDTKNRDGFIKSASGLLTIKTASLSWKTEH